MCLTFPKLSRELYYSRFALWFSSSPFPVSTSDVFLGQFLPNGVWAVIYHVPLSVTKMRWQRPWGTRHCATWTTNTCAYIMVGRFWESRGMGEGYIQPRNTREKSSQRSCNQREKSCINHDNTFRRQPPLHQWRKTGSQWGEGSSQYGWIYYADVAWGVWGGRALAFCAGRPAYTSHEIAHGMHTGPSRLLFDKISSSERRLRQRKAWTWPPKNMKFKWQNGRTANGDNMGKIVFLRDI